ILAFANNNISDIDTSGIVVPMMTFESSYNPMDQTAFENAVYPHGKELRYLHCAGNNLSSFDKSMFEWLGELELSSNDFSVLDISNVRRIDIQNMGDMERISIELTEYNYIFVDGSSPAEFLLVGDPSTLCYLSCNGCGFSSIPDAVFESETLNGLLCADNNLTGTLDLSMSASLSELDCSGNAIDSLILSEESEFSQLIVKDTGISELHVENSYNGAPISLHAENGYVGLSLQGSSELVKVGDDIMEIKHADTVLWAAPAQGYEFAGWYDAQGGLVSSELEYKLEEGYEYDLTAAFVEAVEPTEEPTDEPIVTSEPTDEPVVTSEPTDEPVVTSEPSPEVPPTGFAGMALLGIAAISAGIGINAYRRRED
ncbi:MAG: PT domain-containing protein, partial [Clostridium sp.]|nr:PT domain-containing protein [Clostridium sp.]